MLNIMIKDLELSNRLDKNAMAIIMGGAPITSTSKVKVSETYKGTQLDATTGFLSKIYTVLYRTVSVTMDDESIDEKRPF